ncbi:MULTISPECIES: hypothetical protein [unclassified Kocuria]|uniref:hypothetical protein n=1 Tax=unclassified Kocuria TaxID=2649579 RepID=UPI00064B2E23|nr:MULTISPECIES: hypothetical protein [unclassified Kocuria]KLU08973.1 hypothetical protein ABL57_15025 [Kocuria sp. SM24M-10]OLT06784.1 hypothetical protein BJF77_15280 [Kocuria sp. CNJ-770]
MSTTAPFCSCAQTVPTAFCETLSDYASARGVVITAEPASGVAATQVTDVVLTPDPDLVFDLTMRAIRDGDVPADFQDGDATTEPGSAHHAWATATAEAYNRHRLTRHLPTYQREIAELAEFHDVGAVQVQIFPVQTTTVLQQLSGIKNPT